MLITDYFDLVVFVFGCVVPRTVSQFFTCDMLTFIYIFFRVCVRTAFKGYRLPTSWKKHTGTGSSSPKRALCSGVVGSSSLPLQALYCPIWISSMGNLGCFSRGKARWDRVTPPNLRCMLSVLVFHNPSHSDMDYRISNVHTDVNACDCTRGCTGTRISLHWKWNLGEKYLLAPGNRTCVSGVPVRYSTNWATSLPLYLVLKNLECVYT